MTSRSSSLTEIGRGFCGAIELRVPWPSSETELSAASSVALCSNLLSFMLRTGAAGAGAVGAVESSSNSMGMEGSPTARAVEATAAKASADAAIAAGEKLFLPTLLRRPTLFRRFSRVAGLLPSLVVGLDCLESGLLVERLPVFGVADSVAVPGVGAGVGMDTIFITRW